MKRRFAALSLFSVLWMAGCANDGPTGPEIQEQFGRGMRGEGQLSSDIDRTNDPYVRPRDGGGGPSS